jgi:hypothetical protein
MNWLLRPAPPRRLALLRILVGAFATLYLVARYPHLVSFGDFPADRFSPVGPVGLLDEPLAAGAVTGLVLAAIAAGVAFTSGWRYRITGPAFALLFLWVTTYRNSWGTVLHTENLVALQVLVIGLVRAADAFSLDARRLGAERAESWRYGWPIRLVTVVTVATYFVSGWAKIRFGGAEWLFGDTLRHQIAYDNLRKLLLGDYYSPFGGWLTQFGWLFPPMAIGSAVVELGAPLALLNGRWGRWWAGAAWSFHLAIMVVMAIVFAYQLSFIAFAAFFRLEVGWAWLRKRSWHPMSQRPTRPSPG